MNLPNLLTLSRLLLVPIFTIFLLYERKTGAFILFLAAGVTDALDGLLARLWDQKTKLGAYLDPIADKLLLVTAFIVLASLGRIPLWLTVIVIARDLIILLGFLILSLLSCSFEVRPTLFSKATTVSQVVTVSLVLSADLLPLFSPLIPFSFWTAALLTCISGLQYIYKGMKILEEGG